ncbi:MAG: RecQ family ATP-dependent DNA helicase [Defluviitaleaceae bacterium]|nr:RecQ family ATP-dependent DNA helicase [Defluviitaleaceae bacterium]
MSVSISFFDFEIVDEKIADMGAVRSGGGELHTATVGDFIAFTRGSDYLCGHNIIAHDLKYLYNEAADAIGKMCIIDTLYLSPLLFPVKPHHRLVKDDKLDSSELNNPLNDAKKARDLFFDEVAAFRALPPSLRAVYTALLADQPAFAGFFHFIGYDNQGREDRTVGVGSLIRAFFAGKICAHAPIEKIAGKYPAELAYALSLINVIIHDASLPPWVLRNFPRTENVLRALRSQKCPSCAYCDKALDEMQALRRFFHYEGFREYDGVPLQQSAVRAAVAGKSILAVFPTGGGKSITFQLPALMAGEAEKGLTVVISPLQSLMKDQVDNLENAHNITSAVTINGSLDPLERAKAFERVESGAADILYISPESLRSRSIERLLAGRNVTRFVIDEAHCFSAWGQDFRVDYLYIGEFIKQLQVHKNMPQGIPVSCFTATAKQRVIADIREYFNAALGIDLEVFRARAARVNLRYHILPEETDDGKNGKLCLLLEAHTCPTIIYVSRTDRAMKLAEKLSDDGFEALPYHGKMEKRERIINQDRFMSGEADIIVATTAFGMGVDKKDVGMVIHYDISASIEDYVQEAGRAGRDETINADCYVLYADEDLNKHFNLLNQTKLSLKEIKQIWRALKELTRKRARISLSALEIARAAGWDDTVNEAEMETRVKTAVSELEQSGFVKRGQNMPRIFADSIRVADINQARAIIDRSGRFDDRSREMASHILHKLFSAKRRNKSNRDEGESRVDYLSDRLGIVKEDVIRVIGLLREERILSDAKDLTAHLERSENKTLQLLFGFIQIEYFLCGHLSDEERTYNIKEINEKLEEAHPTASMKQLNTILNYFEIKRFIRRTHEDNKYYMTLKPRAPLCELRNRITRRHEIADFIIKHLHVGGEELVLFSVLELQEEFNRNLTAQNVKIEEIEDALYYLLKIDAIKIDGGFLVIYNTMHLERLERDNKALYKKEHYTRLEEYYQNKRQQIHIVGEYAKRLSHDYQEAMLFVDDYFTMDYALFLNKYFRGRRDEITKNITPKKFAQLFGELSASQLAIINDHESRYIVVAAGPGSGKTKLLTHKLASLYMMEDVKHEQMLMLTFSRAAATEFKVRLMALMGNAAHYIQITTFHSYCFDLLGKVGDLEKSDTIVTQAVGKIKAGEVDRNRLTKTVLVIDEAQDMSAAEFELVKALMELNEEMRIIAVGDDDQNIYEFRHSDSSHFASLLREPNAAKYELVENFRSRSNIVMLANRFAERISNRLKGTPIMPVIGEVGEVCITRVASPHVEVPAVQAFLRLSPPGSTCIITRKNEEAFGIVGLLAYEGVPARLIQSNDGFSLHNLMEMRDFTACFDDESYAITDDIWENAKAMMVRKYGSCASYPRFIRMINRFEATNNKTRYKSDFLLFMRESKWEDFIDGGETVLVSTIHQTKGKEFDNVFMALGPAYTWDDAAKRAVYVALTRAKKNLYIFTCDDAFDHFNVPEVMRSTDDEPYAPPARINFSLGLREVYLGFDAFRNGDLNGLVSGQTLDANDRGCTLNGCDAVRFSKRFAAFADQLREKGYEPKKARINHIVFWKDKETGTERKIILPEVTFEREYFLIGGAN